MFSLFPNTVAKLGEVKEAGILTLHACLCAQLFQSCPTLCHSMDCSPPGSSVREIFQARILECVVIPFSRASSRPRDQIQVSCITGRFLTIGTTTAAAAAKSLQLCPTL